MNDPQFKPHRRTVLHASVAAALAAALPARAKAAETGVKAGEISPLMRTLSAYIAQAAGKPLPDEVIEVAKHHLLDTLAAMISGSRLLPGKLALAYVRKLGGAPEACVPGSRIMTNVVNAALAGGMCAHADETDDVYTSAGMHPGAVTVPAALAMAERHRAGGTALLRAVVLGYDMSVRFSFALGAYAFSDAGYDTHGYAGTFGAAAAAGSIAGLNADRVRYLLSYAAQQASGLSDFPRDTQHIEKAFNFGGRPAASGVAAATMVGIGMTGIDDVFSGDKNFFAAFGPQVKPEEAVRELGARYDVMRTSVKKWSVGNPAQAPLDSLYELIKANRLKADDIEKIVVRIDRVGANTVNNRSMPDINIQYLASVMLLDGTLTLAAAHDVARMQNGQVLELSKRVELIGDEEMTRALPARHAVVEIKLRDGRELRKLTTQVRGTPGNPVTRGEVTEKTFDLCAPVLGKKRVQALTDAIWRIEKIADARALRPLLTP